MYSVSAASLSPIAGPSSATGMVALMLNTGWGSSWVSSTSLPFCSAVIISTFPRPWRAIKLAPYRRHRSASAELEELDEIAVGVFQCGDHHIAILFVAVHCRALDKLDPGLPQSLAVRLEVVTGEAYHVPGRVGIRAAHLAMSAQQHSWDLRRIGAHEGVARCLHRHLEAEHVPVERQQVVNVFAPD